MTDEAEVVKRELEALLAEFWVWREETGKRGVWVGKPLRVGFRVEGRCSCCC
jgi:hypothetical protein